MCLVCEAHDDPTLLQGLEELYCFRCPNLTYIPPIPGLKVIDCYECPLLTEITVTIQLL
jgi:hypothetical protein